MTTDDVMDKTNILIIHVPDTKTYKQRTFTVCNVEKENFIDVVAICKNYFSLRPPNIKSRRLFVRYQGGKCTAQHVGHHTIGTMPFKIATYLKLSNAKEYTGHAFRRSSATLLANSGADILALKRHGGWKSSSIAEGYVEDCLNNKINITKKLFNTNDMAGLSTMTITPNESTCTETAEVPSLIENIADTGSATSTTSFSEEVQLSNLSKQGISFVNCTIHNPIFNITVKNNSQ